MTAQELRELIREATTLLATPVVSAFVGGLTGILGSWFVGWMTFTRERKHESKSTFVAIKAEITSIVALMRLAKYEQGILSAIQYIEKTNEPYYFIVPIQIELFTKVYSDNIGSLGTLSEKHLPDIIGFYANVYALVMNLEHFKRKDQDTQWEKKALVFNQLNIYKASLERLQFTISLGEKITSMH